MSWPPRVGEVMPRAAHATGVREKLAGYSLNIEHRVGGPKARSFQEILGITIEHLDQLEAEIRAGILTTPVVSVRDNPVRGYNCVVEIPVRGVGEKRERTVKVRTAWELAERDAVPRLVTAFPRP